MSTLSRDAIRDDVVLMTGGHFTGTALGPVAYDEILNRARASATDYLDLFEELFLGSRFDALAQSNFQLPMFLGLMADADPTRVRRVAETLLKQYDAVLGDRSGGAAPVDAGRHGEHVFPSRRAACRVEATGR